MSENKGSAPDTEVAQLMELVNSLYAQLEHRTRQLAAIGRISNALFPLDSIDVLMRKALGVGIEIVDGEVGSVQLYDAATDSLVFRFAMGPGQDGLIGTAKPASEGINGRVFSSGVSDLSNAVGEHEEFNPTVDGLMDYRTQSMLTVPIKRTDGHAIGVMQVLNGRRPFDKGDLEVLEVLCNEAALALENSLLLENRTLA